jgi:uncharacterized protein (DUF1697 family)
MAASGKTWVALLRGINVGRAKRVAMGDLRALLESLGYGDVRTHGQSGNVVFTAGKGGAPALEKQIASKIEADLGLDVKVLVRTARELAAVVDANPFVKRKVDPKELHVAFLSGTPPAKKLASLNPAELAPDEFAPGKRVLYLRQPNGIMGSRLPDWEKMLGLTVTARNWNTTTKLRDLAAG